MIFSNIFKKRRNNVISEMEITGVCDVRDLLKKELQNLAIGKTSILRAKNLVSRTFLHTLYWMESYIIAEKEELISFNSEDKYYKLYIINYECRSKLRVVFRLQTVNLSGYTEYGIDVVRVGDYFICAE